MESAIQLLVLLVIASASVIAARQFDHRLGGTLLSLPWITGPLSLLLALRSGPDATAATAAAAVTSVVGVALLFAVYRLLLERTPWWLAPGGGGVAWCAVNGLLIDSVLTPIAAAAAAGGALAGALAFTPRGRVRGAAQHSLMREIGARATATVLLWLLLNAAGRLSSPQVCGMLLVFPFLSTASIAMIHRSEGSRAAADTLAGALRGQAAVLAFFLAVALAVRSSPLALTYGVAALAAIAALAVLAGFDRWRERGALATRRVTRPDDAAAPQVSNRARRRP